LLLDFGKNGYKIGASQENYLASRFGFLRSVQTVIYDLKLAYYTYVMDYKAIQVNKETVAQRKAHLSQAEQFYANGQRSKLEVTKAQADLAQAEVTLLQSLNQFNLDLVNLNKVMGTSDYEVAIPQGEIKLDKQELALPQALSLADEQHPDLQQARAKARGALDSLRSTQKNYDPQVNASANYGNSGQSFPLGNQWSVGASLSFPVFDGYQTKGQIEQAKGQYNLQQANEQSTWLQISSQVESSILNINNAREKITASRQALVYAQEGFDLAEKRYRLGLGSNLDYLDSQITLSNAKMDFYQSQLDYKNAQAQLEYSIGTALKEGSINP